METVPIFANHLYTVRYSEGDPDEFERKFMQWSDIEYFEDVFS